ncbi:MAG: hypothetical protein HY578_05750 [Nitrospinae bacterium]|nr:hypothetical protein [Nitrospinota bacterium]
MKKLGLAVGILFAVTGFIAISVSSVSASDGFNVSLGVKGWANQWETSFFFNDSSFAGKNIKVTTDSKFVAIPVLAVKYGNVFISGSYYAKTNFTFNKFNYRATYSTVGTITETLESSADRSEWDANIGYYIHPSVALSVGYKNITQDYTQTVSSPGITYSQPTTTSTTEIRGPTVGIIANKSIGSGFGLYGNISYGWLKAKYTGVSTEDNSSYTLTDTGFNYMFGSIPLLINLGYRYQAMYTDASPGLKAPDITTGFVLGANLVF